jgi:hypothetical protein
VGRLRFSINWYVVAFVVVALLSFYFQMLYAWRHATPLNTSGGITDVWLARLQSLVDARVVVAPLALPLIATIYTVAGLGKGGEVVKPQRATSIRVEQPSRLLPPELTDST